MQLRSAKYPNRIDQYQLLGKDYGLVELGNVFRQKESILMIEVPEYYCLKRAERN